MVKSVTASATAETGKFQFTVTGNNPCGAVFINLNDGSEGVTYAIQRLPYTVLREFENVGTHRVTAKGMGNCDGEVTTDVTVTAVRPRPATPRHRHRHRQLLGRRNLRHLRGRPSGLLRWIPTATA